MLGYITWHYKLAKKFPH